MSCVYYKQRKYDEALVLYNTSLDIFLKKRGPDHPGVAALYDNMAVVYETQVASLP